MVPNRNYLDPRFPGYYRLVFDSPGGPMSLALAHEGGFDGNGADFAGHQPGEEPNGVDVLAEIGHGIARAMAAGNTNHDGIRLVAVEQLPERYLLWEE